MTIEPVELTGAWCPSILGKASPQPGARAAFHARRCGKLNLRRFDYESIALNEVR